MSLLCILCMLMPQTIPPQDSYTHVSSYVVWRVHPLGYRDENYNVEGSLFHLSVCQNVVSTWDASGPWRMRAWHVASSEGEIILLCWNREPSTVVQMKAWTFEAWWFILGPLSSYINFTTYFPNTLSHRLINWSWKKCSLNLRTLITAFLTAASSSFNGPSWDMSVFVLRSNLSPSYMHVK